MNPRQMLDRMIAIKAMHEAQGRMIDEVILEMGVHFRPQPKSDEVPTPETCTHPQQSRLQSAAMGHSTRWQCGICGHVGE